jgi:hypothetical protein
VFILPLLAAAGKRFSTRFSRVARRVTKSEQARFQRYGKEMDTSAGAWMSFRITKGRCEVGSWGDGPMGATKFRLLGGERSIDWALATQLYFEDQPIRSLHP